MFSLNMADCSWYTLYIYVSTTEKTQVSKEDTVCLQSATRKTLLVGFRMVLCVGSVSQAHVTGEELQGDGQSFAKYN
jgi:hypothetical protein